jgi:subtilisin family serine protease
MASAKHLMKRMNLSAGPGVGMAVLDTGVGFGASYAIGRAYHQYGDKWYGKHVARIAAAAGKLGAVALSMTVGPGLAAGVANSVGQAGVNAIGLEMGLRHARKKTGKKAVLLPAGAALPAGASEMTSIGALGKAAAGRGLSWDQIAELARGV